MPSLKKEETPKEEEKKSKLQRVAFKQIDHSLTN